MDIANQKILVTGADGLSGAIWWKVYLAKGVKTGLCILQLI